MNNETLNSIAQRIQLGNSKPRFIMLGKEGYVPATIRVENFKPIPEPKSATIAFVDSGNAELAAGANFSLQFMRACAVISEQGKHRTIREEFTCLVQAKQARGMLAYSAELFGSSLTLPLISLYEQSLAEGTHRVEPSRVAELVRTIAEHKLAARICAQLPPNSFLVRDGDLQAHTLYEQTALREIYEQARLCGITVAGLSKTSTMLTDTGHAAIPVLLQLCTAGTWYYHPIATSSRADHQASVCAAKLHHLAATAFRIDVFDQQAVLLPELVAALATQSADAAFPGYPYGFIAADRYACVREEERAYLRLRAELALGSILKREEATLTAHEQLNKAK